MNRPTSEITPLKILRNPVANYAAIAKGIKKRLYQRFVLDQARPKQPVFIFGCQRSGTTMLSKIFKQDLNTKIYGELKLSKDNGLRLKPDEVVEKILAQERASLLVAKPLVESQQAARLLNRFAGAKGIWVYRHYQDVANSSLTKFGTGSAIKNLRPIAHPNLPTDWASENVSEATRQFVGQHFSEAMPPQSAAALFWYARNQLYFEQALDENQNMFLCQYEMLVSEPGEMMRRIYNFLELPYPGDHLISEVHTNSINRGSHIQPTQNLDQACAALLAQLNDAFQSQAF